MAYLDLIEPDPNKNRRNGLIAFVICVLLLGTLVKCAGQVVRTKPYAKAKHITQISSQNDLLFFVNRGGKSDTLFVGLSADSLKKDTYYMIVYVYYPKGLDINSTSISLGFKGEGVEILKSDNIVQKSNYASYRVTNEQCMKIRKSKIEYIAFVVNDDVCPFDYEGNFFSNFFKIL